MRHLDLLIKHSFDKGNMEKGYTDGGFSVSLRDGSLLNLRLFSMRKSPYIPIR